MRRYAVYFLLAVLGFGSSLILRTGDAGQIEGTVSAPKPSEAVVYVEKVPGTFQGEHAKMD